MFRLEYMDQNAVRFQDGVARVGDAKKAHHAFRRAINHTGSKARTQVFRALAKQVGLSQRDLKRHGRLRVRRANFDALEYTITSKGRAVPLKYFRAKQFKGGVKASPWGERRFFKGLFINAGTYASGIPVGGGHVFRNSGMLAKRSGRENLPKMGYGPMIPRELIKEESARAFEDAAQQLGPRVEHEFRRLTDGVVG